MCGSPDWVLYWGLLQESEKVLVSEKVDVVGERKLLVRSWGG